MLYAIYVGFIVAMIALTGCGSNPDYGKSIKTKSSSSAVTSSASLTGPVSSATFGPCKTNTVYNGSSAAIAADFSGSSSCASTSNLRVVRVKVNAQFPQTSRVCVVPLSFSASYPATCFTINGQADVTLSTDQFTAVTLVYEAHLSSYTSYLNGQVSSYPPMAYAAVR